MNILSRLTGPANRGPGACPAATFLPTLGGFQPRGRGGRPPTPRAAGPEAPAGSSTARPRRGPYLVAEQRHFGIRFSGP